MKETPEELSLFQALEEGMKAGLLGRSWAYNPYDSNTPEHKRWEEGRRQAEAVQLAGMTA